MSAMKAFAEDISEEMGLGGEITDEVLEEADKRLKSLEILRLLVDRRKKEYRGDFAGLADIRGKLMFLLAPEKPEQP